MTVKLTFQGHEITVNDRGRFCTNVAGKHVSSSSFDGIKKQIRERVAFEPFEAINERDGHVARVLRQEKTSWGWQFLVEDTEYRTFHRSSVIRNTPENRAAFDEARRIERENRKKIEALKQEIDDARAKVLHQRVEE